MSGNPSKSGFIKHTSESAIKSAQSATCSGVITILVTYYGKRTPVIKYLSLDVCPSCGHADGTEECDVTHSWLTHLFLFWLTDAPRDCGGMDGGGGEVGMGTWGGGGGAMGSWGGGEVGMWRWGDGQEGRTPGSL